MRFNEKIHWSDGLFLQPHHLQRMQRVASECLRNERRLAFAFPSGLIDIEIDEEALASMRFVLKRLSAVMPNGLEVSMPGNARLSAIEIEPPRADAAPDVTVYIVVPDWSSHEANLSETDSDRRLYKVREEIVRDENTGTNEVSVMVRRLNAELTTTPENFADCSVMPVARLRWLSHASSAPRLALDPDYMPPFLLVSKDCPLISMVNELLFELRARRDRILSDLDEAGFNPDTLAGAKLRHVLQLVALNRFEARLAGELAPGRMTPYGLYLELRVLAGELSALRPLSRSGEAPGYRHDDALPAFTEILASIRSLILAEGAAGYVRADFAESEGGRLEAALSLDALRTADACYLALSTAAGDQHSVAEAVEAGNNFRLLDPSSVKNRFRGIRLSEVRYPPRYLPQLPRTVWFRLDLGSSESVWRGILDSERAVIDCAGELFPDLKASLFITVMRNRG